MNELVEKQKELKEKIKRNLHDYTNTEGFLVHTMDKYNACLGDIDPSKLDTLLN